MSPPGKCRPGDAKSHPGRPGTYSPPARPPSCANCPADAARQPSFCLAPTPHLILPAGRDLEPGMWYHHERSWLTLPCSHWAIRRWIASCADGSPAIFALVQPRTQQLPRLSAPTAAYRACEQAAKSRQRRRALASGPDTCDLGRSATQARDPRLNLLSVTSPMV